MTIPARSEGCPGSRCVRDVAGHIWIAQPAMISVVYHPQRRGPAVGPIVLFERELDKFTIWACSAIRPADATMEQLVELFDQARFRQEYTWKGPACEDVRR